jgi:hypothetical protein
MLEKTRLKLEGLAGSYVGWHDPLDRWNGFANPLLSREESMRLVAEFNEQTGAGVRYAVEFSVKEDAFTVSFIEDNVVVRLETITARDVQGVGHIYDWGSGWCWLEEGAWHEAGGVRPNLEEQG